MEKGRGSKTTKTNGRIKERRRGEEEERREREVTGERKTEKEEDGFLDRKSQERGWNEESGKYKQERSLCT